MTAPGADARSRLEATIRHLASIDRPSASVGEHVAAEWIAVQLRELGCDVEVDKERAHGTYWWPVGLLTAAAAIAGLASLWWSRVVGVVFGSLAVGGLVDDIDAGRHWLRHALLPYSPTWNVVAEAGDRSAARTLVVLAHHDAAHSGLVFHQGPQRWTWRNHPGWIERMNSGVPFWFAVVGGPALVALGSALGRRAIVRLGTVMSAVSTAAMADIGSRPAVPGANDNLTAVAVLIELARALRAQPVSGLRVLLVSAGSEESLQEGILAFAARHFHRLPVDQTWFLNLDTVGSPHLRLVDGEGVLKMRMYDADFKTDIESVAAGAGVALDRGGLARSSTDAAVPMKAGYPTALLTSLTDWKTLANYHWPTDIPDNVDFETVAGCARVVEGVARRMASRS